MLLDSFTHSWVSRGEFQPESTKPLNVNQEQKWGLEWVTTGGSKSMFGPCPTRENFASSEAKFKRSVSEILFFPFSLLHFNIQVEKH